MPLKSKLDPSKIYPAFDEAMSKRFRVARIRHCKKHWKNRDNIHPSRIKDPCTCINQRTAAELLGVSQKMISRLELGQISVSPFTEEVLRSVFKDDSDFILTGVGEENYMRFQHKRVRTWDVTLFG